MSAQDPLQEFSRLSVSQCRNNSATSPKQDRNKPNSFEIPVSKIAERVKLKRTMEMEDSHHHITGNELNSRDVSDT